MGEVIKSGVAATFPLQGDVQSQPKGVEKRSWWWWGCCKGRWHTSSTPTPSPCSLHSSQCPSSKSPHPVPGESGAGWGPGLSTPASGLCAQGEVTWLAYTMALSQFQPRLLQRWALPVPLQALPVLGVAAQTVRLPSHFWNTVELLAASLWVAFLGIAQCVLLAPLCWATRQGCRFKPHWRKLYIC